MNRSRVFFFLVLMLLPLSSFSLDAWQNDETQPQKKQLNVSAQAAVEEFEKAVKRFEDSIAELDDSALQNQLRYDLVKIHAPSRKKRAVELIRTLDRELLPDYLRGEFDGLKYKLEGKAELFAKLQYKQADRRASKLNGVEEKDDVYFSAMKSVAIEHAQPFLEEIKSAKFLNWSYHDLTLRAIERGDGDLADELIEKWFVQAKIAESDFVHLPAELYRQAAYEPDSSGIAAIERAKNLSRRVVDFAIEKASHRCVYSAVQVAAATGMPELVIKAHDKFQALETKQGWRLGAVEYFLVEAYAHQGNYELAMKLNEEMELDRRAEIMGIIVNKMAKEGEVELAKELVEKTFEGGNKIGKLLDLVSAASDNSGLRTFVDESLAECRQLALELVADEEESIDEHIYWIALAHLQLGKKEEVDQWIGKLTSKRHQTDCIHAEVRWLARQIDK